MKLLRKWRAKGHGVHSPFAFHLIRNVIHSPHQYYAIGDIEKTLPEEVLCNQKVMALYRLSFRLAHHFQPTHVLEIGDGNHFNTTYITKAGKNICCTSKLLDRQKYDAIYIYTPAKELPTIESLLSLSHDNTFWVIHSIKTSGGKQIWQQILADERTRVTFDVTDTGIVFLNPQHHKLNYFV